MYLKFEVCTTIISEFTDISVAESEDTFLSNEEHNRMLFQLLMCTSLV